MATPSLPPDFFIYTSIRYEPNLDDDELNLPYYLLTFHLQRLRDAAAAFSIINIQRLLDDDESGLQLLRQAVDDAIADKTTSWRVNVQIYPDCKISTMIFPLQPLSRELIKLPIQGSTVDAVEFIEAERDSRQLPLWDILIDSVATPKSKFTGHKTSVRDMYNKARSRAALVSYEERRETLLWNEDGYITEGSITTVYVWRQAKNGGKRYLATPPLSTGCNAGASRRYALKTGLCVEEVVHVSDLVEGDEMWLSHASDGFFPGMIIL